MITVRKAVLEVFGKQQLHQQHHQPTSEVLNFFSSVQEENIFAVSFRYRDFNFRSNQTRLKLMNYEGFKLLNLEKLFAEIKLV